MMLHLDYAKRMEESGLIEELFMHEGAHVSLDGYHQKVLEKSFTQHYLQILYHTISTDL